jgi:hypothetical protein
MPKRKEPIEMVAISEGAVPITEERADGTIVDGFYCTLTDKKRSWTELSPWGAYGWVHHKNRIKGYRVTVPTEGWFFFRNMRVDDKWLGAFQEALTVAIKESRRKGWTKVYVAFPSSRDFKAIFPKAKHVRALIPELDKSRKVEFVSMVTQECDEAHDRWD